MKKYLLSMMLTMSVIFVVPAMAETDSEAALVQMAETSSSIHEAEAETQPVTTAETQTKEEVKNEAESQTEAEQQTEPETQSEPETQVETIEETKPHIIATRARSKGPGELMETTEPETEAPTEAVETTAPLPANRWGVILNDEEKDLLARITMLESGGESDLGQQAVVEVILNRVYSPSYPNSVYGVLSHVDCGYRQFSTWKSRNSRAAAPSARVIANVNAVLNGETNILPYETVYFSRKAANKRVQARIGNHVFCNR